ncbi:MAG: alpha amylase C-terminal domain-containing protein [Kouleothrix sp.]|nr:alpha amylase C-terminal domain-containing protein [Kouleothrix sp.]
MDAAPRVAPAPPNTPYGAHDRGDGTVSFALWAPWKKSVHLIGDFNGWDLQADPLAVDESGRWWIEKRLDPGTHAYQFVLDGETTIGDPYARGLRWAAGSPQPHALVEVGARPYEWGDGGFGIKPLNQLVIYELHVGDFSPAGTFAGVIERLDYLAGLGVDAIELMPIQEFPGDRSWGYNPAYFFTPEGAYGSPEDFKRLVDAAHQKGIGVIFDMVFNHAASDSPLNLLYPYDRNPYFSPDGNPWGFPDFNLWGDATKRLIKDIQDYWLIEFHVDGFRYDYVEGMRYDGVGGMSFISWAARQTKPHAYLIAEDIVADPAAVVRDTDIDASWHWQFTKALRAQLREGEYQGNQYGDLELLARVISFAGDGYQDNAQPVNYLESHDEERLIFEVMTNPAIDQAGAVRKSMLGAIMLFTAQGVPMLYHGQEFGAHAPKTIDVSKIPWEHMDGGAGQALYRHYASLAYLRHTQGALQANNFEPLLLDHERRVLAYHRWNDAGSVVVVAVNLSPADQRVAIDFPRAGRWHEWLHDYDEQIGEGPHEVDLPDSFGKIWVFEE